MHFGWHDESWVDREEAELYMEKVHEMCHDLEFDPEETIVVAFSRVDILLFALGMGLVSFEYDCLNEKNADLQARVVELIDAQHPDWLPGAWRDE